MRKREKRVKRGSEKEGNSKLTFRTTLRGVIGGRVREKGNVTMRVAMKL